MDKNFLDLCNWLLRGCIDFDYISESLLPEQCDIGNINNGTLPVGEMNYETIIIPGMETIRATTLDRLEQFAKSGGRVIVLGNAPTLVDAKPSTRGNSLPCENLPFERIALINKLSELRDIEIRTSDGKISDGLIYQLREEYDCKWLFIAQADKPVNPDIPQGAVRKIKIRGAYNVTVYETLTADVKPMSSVVNDGWTCFDYIMYEHDSLLLKLEDICGDVVNTDERVIALNMQLTNTLNHAEKPKVFLEPVPITLHEPNVLLLDMPEFALDEEPYRPREEVLRLDNILRKELNWSLRGEAVAQPWVEHDTSTPHTLRLRYTFYSEISIECVELALENAEITKVTLNGKSESGVNGYFIDKCIGTIYLFDIKAGENVIELTIPYGKKTDIEACYLIGDFGVSVQGVNCTLTAPVTKLVFGDIVHQGLPFYGGNLTYHLEVDSESDELDITVPYYRGHLLRVAVDGNDEGVIAFSPYRKKVKNLKPGNHKIDIKYFGSRINTFGQLHKNNHNDPWYGPDSWRTTGDAWTYEYRFWQQGVMKSPEIKQGDNPTLGDTLGDGSLA